jgi:hypothetical protein
MKDIFGIRAFIEIAGSDRAMGIRLEQKEKTQPFGHLFIAWRGVGFFVPLNDLGQLQGAENDIQFCGDESTFDAVHTLVEKFNCGKSVEGLPEVMQPTVEQILRRRKLKIQVGNPLPQD